MKIFTKLAVTVGIMVFTLGAIAKPNKAPDWQGFGASSEYSIEIDSNSLAVKPINGAWQVFAQLRIKYFDPVKIKDKKKLGVYAISDTIAICKDDTLVFITSILYAKDNTVVDVKIPGPFPNPNIEGNFITTYLDTMCNSIKNYKVLPIT